MGNYITVQEARTTWASGDVSKTITIGAVNTAHSFIIVKGSALSGNQSNADFTAKFNGTGASIDKIVIERYGSPDKTATTQYFVISANIDAPIKAFEIATDEIVFGSGDTSKNETITGLLDTDVIFTQSRCNASLTDNRERTLFQGYRSSVDTLTLERGSSGTEVVCRYWVIRFSSDFTVAKYDFTMTGSNDEDITITSVDVTKTVLFVNYEASSNGLAQGSPYLQLETSTNVSAKRETTTGNIDGNFWTVEFPSDVIVEHSLALDAAKGYDWYDSLNTPVTLANSFIVFTNGCTGTGNAFPRPNIITYYDEDVVPNDQIHFEADYSGQERKTAWFSVDTSLWVFSEGEPTQTITWA